MEAHLIDGTYELFRHYYAVPSRLAEPAEITGSASGASGLDLTGQEIGAVRGVLRSVLGLLEGGASHIGVATDHVIQSFRNRLWAGYKSGEGIDPVLHAQFPWLEDALRAMGVVVWPEVELEADDALASAVAVADADERVSRVLICTPDKDLAQCVRDPRIVQLDRRSGQVVDEAGVWEKFGVGPESIPDWLALVGDSADGFPGLPGWGAKSAAAVLARYRSLAAIPPRARDWEVTVRSAERLAATLAEHRADAERFLVLATLRRDAVVGTVDAWRWVGPTEDFAVWTACLGDASLRSRVERLAEARA